MSKKNIRFWLKGSVFVALMPALIASGMDCPGANQQLTRTGTFTSSPGRTASKSYGFEVPAAPEQPVTASFVVTSPEAIEPSEVSVKMLLGCGGFGVQTSIPVTLTSDGLTKLTGTFSRNARDFCIDQANGQRLPAYWTVYMARIAEQSVTFEWNAQFVQYQQGPQ